MPPYQFTTADGTLVGPLDGNNAQFSFQPYPTVYLYPVDAGGAAVVFRNGVLQSTQAGDYAASRNGTIVIATIPGDTVTGFIFPGGAGPTAYSTADGSLIGVGGINFRVAAANRVFSVGPMFLFRNGILLAPGVDYNVFGGAWITIIAGQAIRPGDVFFVVTSFGGVTCSSVDGSIAGVIDGFNAVFALPFAPQSLMLFRNGVGLTRGFDFILNGNQVTFIGSQLPLPTDILMAQIYVAGGPAQVTNVDGSLAQVSAEDALMFWNGLLMTQPLDGFTTGNGADLSRTPASIDIVTVQAWVENPLDLQQPVLNIGVQMSTADGSITGVMNGVNNVFTLTVPLTELGNGSYVPVTAVIVYWNGLEMTAGVDYMFSVPVVTFMAGQYPSAGDVVSAKVFFQ